MPSQFVMLELYPHPDSPASETVGSLLERMQAKGIGFRAINHHRVARPLFPERPEDIEGPVIRVNVAGSFSGLRYLGYPGGYEERAMEQTLRSLAFDRREMDAGDWGGPPSSCLHFHVFVTPT